MIFISSLSLQLKEVKTLREMQAQDSEHHLLILKSGYSKNNKIINTCTLFTLKTIYHLEHLILSSKIIQECNYRPHIVYCLYAIAQGCPIRCGSNLHNSCCSSDKHDSTVLSTVPTMTLSLNLCFPLPAGFFLFFNCYFNYLSCPFKTQFGYCLFFFGTLLKIMRQCIQLGLINLYGDQ